MQHACIKHHNEGEGVREPRRKMGKGKRRERRKWEGEL